MFRELRADEIECRVSQVIPGAAICLLYKTARTDMDLLDETVGPENWKVEYQEIKGNLYCGLSIKCGDEWITKWNCGIESRGNDGNEKKGEASDAMKRAGFCWGIGRELYTAPFICIKVSTDVDSKGNPIIVAIDSNGKPRKYNPRYEVSEIEYTNRKISRVVITEKGKDAFRWEGAKPSILHQKWLADATRTTGKSEKELIEFAEKHLQNKIRFQDMNQFHLDAVKAALYEGK